MRIVHGRIRWIVLGAIPVLLVVLVGAQLLLPDLAAQRVRERVDRYGSVRSVDVSALPAVEMLWGKVGSMRVKTGRLRLGVSEMANLLWSARQVEKLDLASSEIDLTATGLTASGLLLRDITFHKQGASLSGHGTLRESDLRAALPAGFEVQPVGSGDGEILVKASGTFFGVQTSLEGLVSAQEGKLVVQPTGFPLAGLATLTLFSDPRITIQSVSATQNSAGYDLTIGARIK